MDRLLNDKFNALLKTLVSNMQITCASCDGRGHSADLINRLVGTGRINGTEQRAQVKSDKNIGRIKTAEKFV